MLLYYYIFPSETKYEIRKTGCVQMRNDLEKLNAIKLTLLEKDRHFGDIFSERLHIFLGSFTPLLGQDSIADRGRDRGAELEQVNILKQKWPKRINNSW